MSGESTHFNTYLHVTFCYIKRGDTGMGDTTGEGTADQTFRVVREVVRNLRVGVAVKKRKKFLRC